MSSIVEDMAAVVTRLRAQGIEATVDPRAAISSPEVIVLVEPPTRDYGQLLQTWQLTVLRNSSDVGIETTAALAAVVEQLEGSDFPIESAKPGARRFGTDRPAVPAYFVTFTSP